MYVSHCRDHCLGRVHIEIVHVVVAVSAHLIIRPDEECRQSVLNIIDFVLFEHPDESLIAWDQHFVAFNIECHHVFIEVIYSQIVNSFGISDPLSHEVVILTGCKQLYVQNCVIVFVESNCFRIHTFTLSLLTIVNNLKFLVLIRFRQLNLPVKHIFFITKSWIHVFEYRKSLMLQEQQTTFYDHEPFIIPYN